LSCFGNNATLGVFAISSSIKLSCHSNETPNVGEVMECLTNNLDIRIQTNFNNPIFTFGFFLFLKFCIITNSLLVVKVDGVISFGED